MMRVTLRGFFADEAGATALEFGFMLPVFILLSLGSLSAAIYGFSLVSLQYAVQDGARCAAVKTTVCFDQTSIGNYALAHYVGVDITPVFTYSTSPCAHTLRVNGTFALNVIPQMFNLPMSARACYG